MFVRWSRRSRAYTAWGHLDKEPHRTVIAQLVESRRIDGKPKQRILAHLGTCCEPVAEIKHRHWFYTACDKALASIDLSDDDRINIAAQLAARLPRPTEEEITGCNREADAATNALLKLFRPDGFVGLVRAWNAAREDERQRFLDEVRKVKLSA
jgi:hypothetical protein